MSDCSLNPDTEWTQAECPPVIDWGPELLARLRDDGYWEWVGDWAADGYRVTEDEDGWMVTLVDPESGQPQMIVLGEGDFLNFISGT